MRACTCACRLSPSRARSPPPQLPLRGLHNEIREPDLHHPGSYKTLSAVFTLDLVGATGIALFICAAITSAVFRLHPLTTLRILGKSFRRMALSMLTICILLAFGYVVKFSGMDATLGLAAARAQQGYLILGPFIGFLGVALTGSATTSNVLFGSLQTVAADRLGYNPVQLAASNVAGGVLGHIISTSSMVVACVAVGESGKDITGVARSVIGYALALISLFSLWNLAIALGFPGFIPEAPYV